MDKYQKLYQQVLNLKEKYERKKQVIDLSVKSYNKCIHENDVEIEDLNRKQKKNKYIYSTLVNYKSFIMEKIKTYLKVSGSISVILAALLSIVGLIVSAPITDFLWAIGASVVIGTTVGVMYFKDDTQENREIHKKYKNQEYAYPDMIASLDKQLQIEYEIKAGFQEKVDALNIEKDEVMNVLNECQVVLGYLISRMTEECQFGRNNIKMLNRAFDSDERAQEALKLVREKKVVDAE